MSSNKQTYRGKKWCEYCKTGINWTKEDIAYHEQSRMHKKNVEREIEFKRQKKIREQEQAAQNANGDENTKMMAEIEKKAQEAMLGNSKQPYNPKNTFNQQQGAGKPGIGPQMPSFNPQQKVELTEEEKKELKRQKKKEELGSEFGSSYEESDTDEDGDEFEDEEVDEKSNKNKVDYAEKFDRVWYLSKDEQGKLFFYNQLSGQRRYEKPIGLKLLDEEQRLWDDYVLQQLEEQEKQEEAEIQVTNKKIQEYHKNKQNKDEEEDNEIPQKEIIDEQKEHKNAVNEKEGIIQSEWMEVTEEDNFFNKYAVRNIYGETIGGEGNKNAEGAEEESDDGLDEQEVEKMARIELLIEQGKIETQQQMIEALMQGREENIGSKLKQTEKMKKLIDKNLDVISERKQQVFKKKNWLDDEEEKSKPQQPITNSAANESKDGSTKQESKGSMFKKRISNNKNVTNIPIDN